MSDTKTQIAELLKKIQVSGSFDSARYSNEASKLAATIDFTARGLTSGEEEEVLKKTNKYMNLDSSLSAREARRLAIAEVRAKRSENQG